MGSINFFAFDGWSMSPMNQFLEAAENAAAELLRAELSLLDPAVRGDRGAVSALLADDFVEFGASGLVWTRDQIVDLLATSDYAPPAMEDFSCRFISACVVLVTYRTVGANGQTGQRQVALRSSHWTKQGDRWLIRFHQGTRVT